MKVVTLTQGYVAVVSAGDYRKINRYSWHVSFSKGSKRSLGAPYARATINNKKVQLHRFVAAGCQVKEPLPRDMQVDHINQQTLDNRRENLRLATPAENLKNRRKKPCKNRKAGSNNVSSKASVQSRKI